KQPGRIFVEPTDRRHPARVFPQAIVNRFAALRVSVACDHALGLIEGEIDSARRLHARAVELNRVRSRLHPGFRIAHDAAIDSEAPGANRLTRLGPRGEAVAREDAVE